MTLVGRFTINERPNTVKRGSKGNYKKWRENVKKEIKKQWEGKTRIDSKKIRLDITIKIDENTDVNYGHGPDLDNLLKPIVDGVAEAILSDSNQTTEKKSPDYLVYELNVRKVKATDYGIEIVVWVL